MDNHSLSVPREHSKRHRLAPGGVHVHTVFCHTKSARLALEAENEHAVIPSKISHLLAFSLLHPTGPGSASRRQQNHWPLAHKKGPNPWPKGSQLLLSTPLAISAPPIKTLNLSTWGPAKGGQRDWRPSFPPGQGWEGRGRLPSPHTYPVPFRVTGGRHSRAGPF